MCMDRFRYLTREKKIQLLTRLSLLPDSLYPLFISLSLSLSFYPTSFFLLYLFNMYRRRKGDTKVGLKFALEVILMETFFFWETYLNTKLTYYKISKLFLSLVKDLAHR